MSQRRDLHGLALAAALYTALALILPGPAWAAKSAGAAPGTGLLPGSGSKEPINIDAGKLDYFDKEQKLIYTGDVVAVQGDSTLKASVLTIFLQKDPQAAGAAAAGAATPAAPAPALGPGAGSSVSRMEADGPVTLISKDQVGTGDHATYDKIANKVYLTGNVTLSQGTNVTQGDHLVYDMTSGQAQVFSGDSNNGRVTSVFTPGSGTPPAAQAADQSASAAKPAGSAAKRKSAKTRKVVPAAAPDETVQQ